MISTLEDGSVTSPAGFRAGSATCGLKESGKPDLMLVVSDRDCTAAGVFTRNQVVAAPVLLDRETLAANSTRIRGVVANAGIANACTGEPGMVAARRMQALAAGAVDEAADQMLILSTGVIGVQLDLTKIAAGVRGAAAALDYGGGPGAARAIMTTDTRPKALAVEVELSGGAVRIGGMAKGAGMIHPDMATMLSVLTTDAAVAAERLQGALVAAVERSFNRVSVDGDTSTNDTVLLLANGASGVTVSSEADLAEFQAGLTDLCIELAKMIVRDGEGASRFVELVVTGARDEAEALAVARTIATSPLVKTAIAGGDPNWGRILAAAGRAGIPLDQSRLALAVRAAGGAWLDLVHGGTPLGFREEDAARAIGADEIEIQLDLGLGHASTTMWTCDLTREYITINADYRT
jgi:glutamate N-acetyltransferase/amino-acid N-acetyltransferase